MEAYQNLKVLRDELLSESNSLLIRNANYLGDLNNTIYLLESKLIPISTLFNEIALPYNLWGIALCLLHHSGLDAPDAVRKLWKSILYR